LYLGATSSYDCAALQPLPAPAAAPAAPFNPHLPLQVDVDTLLAAFRPNSTQQQQQQVLQRIKIELQLVCGGQRLPAAAAEALLQGGIAKSLLLLQRTPQVACQVLVEGERLLYAVPLVMFSGELVRLVLLLELFAAPQAISSSSSGGGGGVAQQQQQQQCGLLYCSRAVVPFAEVYPAMRALGPCEWVSWVKEAVAGLAAEGSSEQH
jgi:hypothetical protein